MNTPSSSPGRMVSLLPSKSNTVPVGESLPALTKTITREKIEGFEAVGHALRAGGVGQPIPTSSPTNQESTSTLAPERQGATGQISFAYLHELLARRFGIDFRQGGQLSVSFLRPVYAGDIVTARGVVTSSESVDGRNRLVVQVWLENQDSERTATGEAEITVPSPLT